MIRRIITTFIANTIAFLLAAYFISNFVINLDNLVALGALIAVFSAIQLVLRPIIKLILTPIILITFGLFNLAITAGFLYIVDKFAQNISINGLPALIYSTLIITVVNMIFHTGSRFLSRD